MQPDKPTEPIDEFLREAAKRLGGLPAEKRGQILDEARDHLIARAKELTQGGQSESEAAAVAVASFGDLKQWSSSMVNAGFTNGGTRRGRCIVYITLSYLLAFIPLSVHLQDTVLWPFLTTLFMLSPLTILVASAWACEYNFRKLAAVGAVVITVCLLVMGAAMIYQSASGYLSPHYGLKSAPWFSMLQSLQILGFELIVGAIALIAHLGGTALGRRFPRRRRSSYAP